MIVAYFKVPSLHFPGGTEKKVEKSSIRIAWAENRTLDTPHSAADFRFVCFLIHLTTLFQLVRLYGVELEEVGRIWKWTVMAQIKVVSQHVFWNNWGKLRKWVRIGGPSDIRNGKEGAESLATTTLSANIR
jgi:hypothetical protein